VLKILSTGSEFEGSVNRNFLAIDKENQNFISLVVDPRLVEEKITPGMVIEGIPNRVFGNVIYFTNESSYIRIVTQTYENAFPEDSEMETKIKILKFPINLILLKQLFYNLLILQTSRLKVVKM
jgi:hypothetical protein